MYVVRWNEVSEKILSVYFVLPKYAAVSLGGVEWYFLAPSHGYFIRWLKTQRSVQCTLKMKQKIRLLKTFVNIEIKSFEATICACAGFSDHPSYIGTIMPGLITAPWNSFLPGEQSERDSMIEITQRIWRKKRHRESDIRIEEIKINIYIYMYI